MDSKVTALEVARKPEPTSALTPYEPRTFDEAARIALVYASSGLLGEVRSQEAALLIMATGAELGIPATTALRAVHIVKGKPILSSDLIVALCLKRTDLCEYFICVESTAQQATYETKRSGVPTPTRNTFTIEDAQRAKLGVGNPDSNWGKYPKAMLRHRAAAELARQVYPDIVLGLYSEAEEEEIRSELDVTPRTPPLVTEPLRVAQPTEELSAAMDRWRAELFTAETVADCDRVRREAKKRVVKGVPEYDVIANLYTERVKELRTAHIQAEAPKDAEIVEREPGSDHA
jgi:hypothetical protein